MILHEISLKDKEWRSFAYSLTKDKEKADDLVQEMYLRIYSKCQNKKLTDLYIIRTIKNMFYNSCTKKKTEVYELNEQIKYLDHNDIIDDHNFKILEKAKKLKPIEQELLSMTYDYPLRAIAKQTGVSHVHITKEVTRARKQILGEDLKGYKNKRLRYKKL